MSGPWDETFHQHPKSKYSLYSLSCVAQVWGGQRMVHQTNDFHIKTEMVKQICGTSAHYLAFNGEWCAYAPMCAKRAPRFPKFRLDFQKLRTFLNFHRFLPSVRRVCAGYAPGMRRVCAGYAPRMSRRWPPTTRIFPETSSLGYECDADAELICLFMEPGLPESP